MHEPKIRGSLLDWNGNIKSKKYMQLRKVLECKEYRMIQARRQKPKNYVVLKQALEGNAHESGYVQPKEKTLQTEQKKKEWTKYTPTQIMQPKPLCGTRKGQNEADEMELKIPPPLLFDIETIYAGK